MLLPGINLGRWRGVRFVLSSDTSSHIADFDNRYISFESAQFFKAHGVTIYWILGTSLSVIVMGSGILYIIAEWLTQSHINTTNYAAASRGLRRTRTFKKYTLWIRTPVDLCLSGVRTLWEAARAGQRKGNRGRRSLVWSWRDAARSATTPFAAAAMYEAAESFVSERNEKQGGAKEQQLSRESESSGGEGEKQGLQVTAVPVTRTHSGLFPEQTGAGDALDTEFE